MCGGVLWLGLDKPCHTLPVIIQACMRMCACECVLPGLPCKCQCWHQLRCGPSTMLPAVQRQAAALVDKDTQISKLQERLQEVEALQRQPSGGSERASEKLSEEASGEGDTVKKDTPAWESIPAPETFKEALEQILMLQVR